ncbi:hypothetical protein [Pendulispora albinea]|uniref:Uncharacterized protein n=1 Tax=Pendulispora albinea TaxID=2741071 RepID=A0ABZ2M1V0_9BACT
MIHGTVLERIERELAHDATPSLRTRAPDPIDLEALFTRFEQTQPALARRVTDVLDRPLDQAAIALGCFLSVTIWLAFERTFGKRLMEVSEDALRASEAAFSLEEELRAGRDSDPIELEDIIEQQQPAIVDFVHEHLEAALEGDAEPAERNVDVDDVHLVYRAMLVLTLALSHAVKSNDSNTLGPELLA